MNHKYKHGGRINVYTVIFSTAIFCIWLVSEQNHYNDTYVAEVKAYIMPVVITPEPTMEEKIRHYFPRNGKTMVAIAHAESRMKMGAKGYNCYYSNGVATTTYVKGGSKACTMKDRALAWSVDCFVLQRNYKGQKCPSNVSVDQHLQDVAALSRVQGLSAWVSYNEGLHEKYLTQR